MSDAGVIGASLVGAYALLTGGFLLLENRRPQASLAWMLAFILAPGIGLLVYVLFGRSNKAFSRQTQLLKQDLRGHAKPLLGPIMARADAEMARVAERGFSHRKLVMLIRSNADSALTGSNRVTILQDASTFYPRMLDDIRAARHSIHLQYFIWGADEKTEPLMQALMEQARAGVEVRLLYDPLGSHAHFPRRAIRALQEAGVKVAETSPLYRLHTISYRNHPKITVVDGAIGYTGGMNIGGEHLDGGRGFDSWRDTQVRIVGEAAAMLQAVFMVDWYNAVRENLFLPPYFPSQPPPEPETSDVVQVLVSGPDSRWAAIRQLYFAMIVAARRRVCIQSPYFVIDATLAEAIAAAAMAGVEVNIMITERPSGNPIPGWAGNTYMADVADAGANVFLYRKGYLHAKTISVDGEICSIGSTNIDIRSFSINYEINAVLYSSRMARELEASFDADLPDCVRFDAKSYRRSSLALRLRDSCARLLSPLL